MLSALKALFEPPVRETDEARAHRLQLASAALLIETARADFTQDAVEEQALQTLLVTTLGLSEQEVTTLISQAQQRVDEATSIYEFTRQINDHCSAADKLELIDAMWAVAYADGEVHKYEESLIRKVAELTYVPHGQYIQSKLNARPD